MMLKTYEREKLLNAIIYFAANTANCGKTKLYKLLFLLDTSHYQQTGRSITGMDYYAWKLGPVPADLDNEIDSEAASTDESPDESALWDAIGIKPEWFMNYPLFKIVPKKPFDPDYFTNREISLLEELASKYKDKSAKEMVDITHEPNGPWARVYSEGSGKYERIPFELSLEGDNAARTLEKAKEHESMKEYFKTLSNHCSDQI